MSIKTHTEAVALFERIKKEISEKQISPFRRVSFERIRNEASQEPEQFATNVYKRIYQSDDFGNPAMLLVQAQQMLQLAAREDGKFKQFMTHWMKDSWACIRWAYKSGKEAMNEPRYALQLAKPYDSTFAFCLVTSGRVWDFMVAKEVKFFWKNKLTRWYKRVELEMCDKIFCSYYQKVLKQMQTQESLYTLIIAASFWAHYD